MAVNPLPPPQVAVHPAVRPLSYLLGTWKGQGEGSFPTISPFKYSEELQFSHSPNKKGEYDAEKRSVKLKSELVGNASKVKEITRVFEMVNGDLVYVVEMATDLTSLQTHLKAVLKKI
ncbi:UPF0678 fatty acid-binding protein-like protein [Striga hermonthica]|uniref:UPF0678 fatty acid-binding protein-like protein n=1 Tax=Striga hermonthica TaxID=68872 RepID=A0A9N7R9U1_STRHE|nr:UPF0678 fatty acid-binding protein-like protein [Striga hermonthica]